MRSGTEDSRAWCWYSRSREYSPQKTRSVSVLYVRISGSIFLILFWNIALWRLCEEGTPLLLHVSYLLSAVSLLFMFFNYFSLPLPKMGWASWSTSCRWLLNSPLLYLTLGRYCTVLDVSVTYSRPDEGHCTGTGSFWSFTLIARIDFFFFFTA